MTLLKLVSISLSVLLIGCNSSNIRSDSEMLRHYQAQCNKSIANESYDILCDRYIDLSSDPKFAADLKVAKIRQEYTEERQAYKQKREESLQADRTVVNTRIKQGLDQQYAPTKLSKLTDGSLCSRFWSAKHEDALSGLTVYDKNIEAELKKRGFNLKQLDNARRNGFVSIGSSTCMMYAAMGRPSDENRTITAHLVRIQHVYRERGIYIYSTDGIITTWQD